MFFKSITSFKTLPLGFFHDNVGVGAPSALHVNFTVCPIQDWDVTGVTVSTVAASVKYNHDLTYDEDKVSKKLPVILKSDLTNESTNTV